MLDEKERNDFFSPLERVSINDIEDGNSSTNSPRGNNTVTDATSIDDAGISIYDTDSINDINNKKKSTALKSWQIRQGERTLPSKSQLIASANTDEPFILIPKTAIRANKNKFGIIGKVRKKKKERTWRRIFMKKKLPKIISDSLSIDSLLVKYDTLSMDTDDKQLVKNDSIQWDPYGLGRKRAMVNEEQIQYEMLFGQYLPPRIDAKPTEVPDEKTDFPDEAITTNDIDAQLYEGFENVNGKPSRNDEYDYNDISKYDEDNDGVLSKKEKRAQKKDIKRRKRERKKREKADAKLARKMEKERATRMKKEEKEKAIKEEESQADETLEENLEEDNQENNQENDNTQPDSNEK